MHEVARECARVQEPHRAGHLRSEPTGPGWGTGTGGAPDCPGELRRPRHVIILEHQEDAPPDQAVLADALQSAGHGTLG